MMRVIMEDHRACFARGWYRRGTRWGCGGFFVRTMYVWLSDFELGGGL